MQKFLYGILEQFWLSREAKIFVRKKWKNRTRFWAKSDDLG